MSLKLTSVHKKLNPVKYLLHIYGWGSCKNEEINVETVNIMNFVILYG